MLRCCPPPTAQVGPDMLAKRELRLANKNQESSND